METTMEPSTSMATTNNATEVTSTSALGGKYLTFQLDAEEYGLEILKVREINGIMDITQVPHTHDFVQGVINLRGKVIPVIDLRLRFGLPKVEYDNQTCIIVVDVGTMMGIIVDTVCEVHDIPVERIEPPPFQNTSMDVSFILGMGKVNDEVKTLLNIENVLTTIDLVKLHN